MIRHNPNQPPDSSEEDTGSWIVTFADMVSLLFAFFVILYALSNVDKQKFQAMAMSLHQTFSRQVSTSPTAAQVIVTSDLKMNPSAGDQLNLQTMVNNELSAIVQKLNQFIYEKKLQNQISAFIDDRGVVIKIADDLLFEVGQADLTPKSKVVVDYMVTLIKQFPYPLRVEGHTDNSPIHTLQYPSNWELSTARACNVVRYFIEQGLDPRLFSAEGLAEFRPIASNETASGKSKNRRVEIIYKKERMLEIMQELNKKKKV